MSLIIDEQSMDVEQNKSVDELVNSLKQIVLMDKDEQNNLIDEFIRNKYLKRCDFGPKIDIIVFYLFNYAISLDNLISDELVTLFRDLFSHIDHCFFAPNSNLPCCKITSKLYRSNWLKVYFEAISKIYDYNFCSMNDQLIDFMYVLFKKSSNKQAINVDYTNVINFLIHNTTASLGKNEEDSKKKKKTILSEQKRKIVLLVILILDGQYQPFLEKKLLKKVGNFLDMHGIRMYWQNLNEFDNAKSRVEEIVKFCKGLIESHNELNDIDLS